VHCERSIKPYGVLGSDQCTCVGGMRNGSPETRLTHDTAGIRCFKPLVPPMRLLLPPFAAFDFDTLIWPTNDHLIWPTS
jgi:hypothetical protein